MWGLHVSPSLLIQTPGKWLTHFPATRNGGYELANAPNSEGYNYLTVAWEGKLPGTHPSPSSEDCERQQSALTLLLAGAGACHSLHVRTHSPNDFEGSLNDSFMPGWDWPGFHLQPTTCTHTP